MKRIPHTAEITTKLQSAFGADAVPADYAVYEAIALNQRPIRQKHPLFEGAIAQDSLLRGLAETIETESAPLQLMHDTRALPAGRVFAAKMHGTEVRILFALSLKDPESAPHIAKLDAGVIDQVSVNVLARRLECSSCGWDYLGADASYLNIMNAECANEHQLREDGVHIKMHGVDTLAEISLVGSGGADGARILDKNNSAFASESFQRLAASGLAPAMLVATFNIQGTEDMDMTKLIADLTDAKATNQTLEAKIATEALRADTAEAALAEANTKIAALTAEAEAAAATAAAATETAAPSEAVLAFVRTTCERSLIAAGETSIVVPETAEEQLALINTAQTKLSALIPTGGRANTTPEDIQDDTSVTLGSSAFRRAK
jgi:hypothetical protein